MFSRWFDFVRSPVVPMPFSGQSRQSALNMVLVTGVFSLVGLFLALGADRTDRFSKTCSMGMACCVKRGGACDHPPSEARHDVPPGVRRAIGFEIEAACGCPTPASVFVFRNDGLITSSDFGGTGLLVGEVACFEWVPGYAPNRDLPISPRAPPSIS
jgi:hypothetical protein